jgi:amidase
LTVPRPSLRDLRDAGDALGLGLGDEELAEYLPVVEALLAPLDRIDELSAPEGARRDAQEAASRPGDDPWGAWYRRCSVKGAPEGPLRGRRVALKDSIALAGVPMANGSALLEGYTPDFDATVATRILEAGGEIVGKATCEDMCLSAGSHTAVTGPVRNPHDVSLSSGGSSSGCAVLVAAGECDLAVGGDQGGSIRVPSSLCGIVGHKPTYGLVPYTGAFPLDRTLDHLGPMGRSVAEVALLLDVLAGEDGLDPRQGRVERRDYVGSLEGGVRGLSVGVLREGFGLPGSDERVDALVRGAAESLERLGASVSPVSVPWHLEAMALLAPVLACGVASGVMHGNAVGTNWKGFYPVSLAEWFWRARREKARETAPAVKLFSLVGQYVFSVAGPAYYSKAQNLARALTAAYEGAFEAVDILVLPTTPTTARPLPPPGASIAESLAGSFDYAANTGQFDLTGHPALSVPCGHVDGMPAGMMIVGRWWEDDLVLRAAYAFEQAGGGGT